MYKKVFLFCSRRGEVTASRAAQNMKQSIIELTAAVRELAAAIKEGKEENPPTPPIRRNPKKQKKRVRARGSSRNS
jgi:hypothetical protein